MRLTLDPPDTATPLFNQIQFPWLPGSTANTQKEVALSTEIAEVAYTDALALDYARKYGNWEAAAAAASIEWSDVLALQYAHQYGSWDPAVNESPSAHYNVLALDYARKYGNWEPGN